MTISGGGATASPSPASAPKSGRQGGQLPVTGSSVSVFALGGAALLAVGVAIVVGLRRRRIRLTVD